MIYLFYQLMHSLFIIDVNCCHDEKILDIAQSQILLTLYVFN